MLDSAQRSTQEPGYALLSAAPTIDGLTYSQPLNGSLGNSSMVVTSPGSQLMKERVDESSSFLPAAEITFPVTTCTYPGADNVVTPTSGGEASQQIRFEHPVVNPLITIRMGGNRISGSVGSGSYYIVQLADLRVASVNGAPVSSGQIEMVDTGDAEWDGLNWVRPESAFAAPAATITTFRVPGLVSSIDIDHPVRCLWKYNTAGAQTNSTGSGRAAITQAATMSTDLAASVDAPTEIPAGEPFSWTISTANQGAGDSHGYLIDGAIPAGVTDAHITAGGEQCEIIDSAVSCGLGGNGAAVVPDESSPFVANLTGDTTRIEPILPAGAGSTPITLTGTAPADPGATLSFSASVRSVDSDPDTSNNVATADAITVPSPRLSTSLTLVSVNGKPAGSDTTAQPADVLGYEVSVTNSGTAEGTTVVAAPMGTGAESELADDWTCDDGACSQDVTVAPGETEVLALAITLEDDKDLDDLRSYDQAISTSFGDCAICAVSTPIVYPGNGTNPGAGSGSASGAGVSPSTGNTGGATGALTPVASADGPSSLATTGIDATPLPWLVPGGLVLAGLALVVGSHRRRLRRQELTD
ncbi:hypothetical protein RAC69_09805 [Microbacterium sp. LS_15]|uniref:hypothetical protein n=1 Tax=Microbacterium sp. LS_15 TaxID=3055790 RepID=UPI0035C159A0